MDTGAIIGSIAMCLIVIFLIWQFGFILSPIFWIVLICAIGASVYTTYTAMESKDVNGDLEDANRLLEKCNEDLETKGECGEGTVLKNGDCVVLSDICGPGTEFVEYSCQVIDTENNT